MYIHTSLVCLIQDNLQSSSSRIYILHYRSMFSNGLLTNNSTWCQNRGCICISSTRRTYGRIHMHSAYNPVNQTSTIILWTELFPKKKRGDPRRYFSLLRVQCFHTRSIHSTRTTRNPASFQSSRAILHTELILPQEILQLQGSSCADQYKASSSDRSRVSKPSTWQNPVIRPYSIPGPHGTGPHGIGRLPVNSTQQKQHSMWQPASTQPPQEFPGAFLQNSTRRNRIHFKRVKYCVSK